MFYVFSLKPTEDKTEANAQELPMKLTGGVIHQVDVVFQDGCAHKTYVKICDNGHQIWPSNRGNYLRGNATVISFREFYELAPGLDTLTAWIWNDCGAAWGEIVIQFGLLPKKVIQPLSFDELLAAAAGLE